MFTDVLEGYTSPGGTRVNIQNLMMLAFTQNQHDGNSQFNIITQNQMHISMMAQQQKELLEQQAAVIQAGTDKVLAAQNEMIEHLPADEAERGHREAERGRFAGHAVDDKAGGTRDGVETGEN
jgi:hypothetical protein